jgi:hypothetical protein
MRVYPIFFISLLLSAQVARGLQGAGAKWVAQNGSAQNGAQNGGAKWRKMGQPELCDFFWCSYS